MSVTNGYLIIWMFILLIYSLYRFFRKKSILMIIPICAQIFSMAIAIMCFIYDVEAEQYIQACYILLGILPSTVFILIDYFSMVRRVKKHGAFNGIVEPVIKKKAFPAALPPEGINELKHEMPVHKLVNDLSGLTENVQKKIKKCITQLCTNYAEDDHKSRLVMYETLSAVAPESYMLRYNCGFCCYRMKEYEKALEHFTKAADLKKEKDEELADIFYNIGNIYYVLAKYDKAVQYFEKAHALNPSDMQTTENLAFSYVRFGDRDKGIELLSSTPMENESYRAHYINGRLLYEAVKYGEAEEEFRKAIEILPNSTEAREECARALIMQGKNDIALVMYSEIIKIDKDNYSAWYNMANTLAGLSKWKEAAESYRRATEIRPESYKAFYNMGIALEEIGKRKEAIEAYRRSVELCPDFIEAYNNLGIALSLSGSRDEALDVYTEAIRKDPSDPRLYFNMGMCLYEMENYSNAVAAFRDALEINPEELEIYYYLGSALMELHRYNDAIDAYRSAIKIKPSDSELHYNIAAVYSMLGRYDIAEENLKQAILLNSEIRDDVINNKAFDGMRNRKEFKEMVS
jgi:tetratricopeptide (TPR) repeat protein